ncbi:MAG: sugar phosphate nucleotidyltransferase [Patescibacteria group bacterium]|jgi:bifunctional UDP-N-acetylglucosamine pyrophosphorylase/glucosamine-1-phosphate N-acetyltransferase
MKNITSLILAAGKGTRLNCTDRPKVMLMIGDKPMIEYQVKTMEDLGADRIILVIGFRGDLIKDYLKDRVEYVEQKEQLGTGHAVMMAKEKIKDFDGYVLIAPGDAPFLTLEMLNSLVTKCEGRDLDGCILSVNLKDPLEYGRIVRDESNNVLRIVEKKDATEEQLKIKEINTGVYCFKAKALLENLDLISNNNVQKEYYLTDLIEIMNKKGLKLDTVITDDFEHTMGINRPEELERARQIVK